MTSHISSPRRDCGLCRPGSHPRQWRRFGPASEKASDTRQLHVTRTPMPFMGACRFLCVITPRISRGSRLDRRSYMTRRPVFRQACWTATSCWTQADGDRAVGRCTLDLVTGLGLCTFSDGTGDSRGSAPVLMFRPWAANSGPGTGPTDSIGARARALGTNLYRGLGPSGGRAATCFFVS